MSEAVNGSAGIPRAGREKAYATELWLDDPTAFFLHPEGPLSETTPDEWRAKQAERRAKNAIPAGIYDPRSVAAMMQQHSLAMAAQQNVYLNCLAGQQYGMANYTGLSGSPFGKLFG